MSRHLLIQKQFIWRFDTFLIDKGTIGIYIVYDKTWMYTGINVDQAVKALLPFVLIEYNLQYYLY